MPQVTLNKFVGIAPNQTAFSGRAIKAENVDLSGGGIQPIKASSFVEGGHSGDIVYYNGDWVSGDENYLVSDIQGLPILIHKSQGNWKIKVNSSVDEDLWISAPTGFKIESSTLPVPEAPQVANEGAGAIPEGTYQYYAKFVSFDEDGNELRESFISTPATLTVTEGRVKALRPFTSGLPEFSKWRLYRKQDGAADNTTRFVAEASISETYIYDNKKDSELGQAVDPSNETLPSIDYKYVIVWVREVEGWIHESPPSAPVGVTQSIEGVKISLTETPPAGVTEWSIYRISLGSQATTTFQLVETLDINTKQYLDSKDNIELGAALQSSYRADNGALVTAGVPDDQFDGMAGPFNGFYVGWIGQDLFLSEPGNPAWWPGAYVVQANHKITSVTQFGSNIAVVTEGGVQLGYGSTPDYFVLGQLLQGTGGIGRKNADRGFYLAYNGIHQITENGPRLITTGFSKEFFDDLDTENSTLLVEKERLFLFHSSGALVFDFITSQWTTLGNGEFTFESVVKDGGEIYGLRNGSIVKLFDSNDDISWQYDSTLDFGEAASKRIEALHFYGSGQVGVEMSTVEDEGTIDTSTTADMSSGYEPDRVVYPPVGIHTEAIIYKLGGNSTIRSIMFTVDKVNSES